MSNHSDVSVMDKETKHAHRHVDALLALPMSPSDCPLLQCIDDGSLLTAEALKSGTLRPNLPILITDCPESIGMKLPGNRTSASSSIKKSKKHVTKRLSVRDIADIVGHATPVHVIDVEHQDELEGWTMYDLVEYFEDEHRLLTFASKREQLEKQRQQPQRRRRATLARSHHEDKPRVINQISFEFSHTPLRKLIQSPTFVRDLDWIDHAWSKEWRAKQQFPAVQYYCLTSSMGCYTDFHLDFGGTSVWYHVVCGSKMFVLIEPSSKNLDIYEKWLCRKDQSVVFLPELIEDKSQVIKILLNEDQTFFIPSGWVHAVYTPLDSLVFGGNFLHGLDMKHQINSNSIETRARVTERFRFPFFIPLQFYTGGMYLSKLRTGNVCQRELDQLPALIDALDGWWKVNVNTQPFVDEPSPAGAALDVARSHRCENFDDFLYLLRNEYDCILKEGKPAVRLKIADESLPSMIVSNANPRVKLKLSKVSSIVKKNEFQIQLSQSSLRAISLPKDVTMARNKPREDTLDDVELPDEEWTPETNRQSRGAPRRSQSSLAAAQDEIVIRKHSTITKPLKTIAKKPKLSTSNVPPKNLKSTSSRQRILSKLR